MEGNPKFLGSARAPTPWDGECFLPARCSKSGNNYGNVSGWVAVTLRYCIKMAKPI